MILANFWKYLNAITTITPWDGSGDTDIGMKTLANGIAYIDLGSDSGRGSINRDIENISVRLGTGNNEPSETDYALQNDITSEFTINNVSISAGTDSGIQRTISISATRTASGGVELKEVGIVKNLKTYDHGDLTTLFSRTILDNPISVHQGESILINIEWVES